MKKALSLLLTSLTLAGFAQNDPIIMTVNNEPVYKSEFEQIFWKNKKEAVTNQEELDEYLDLFIKFKLKVEAAEEAGLDETKKFKDEFYGYKVQLQKPYLSDTVVDKKLIEEAYYRTANELRASHLLIKVAADASPQDTLLAYKQVKEIYDEVANGRMSFEEAAIKYSQDESVKVNKGDLGYFSAFRMVYPFEDAAYSTALNNVSEPFKTRFGYHLVYPTATRKSRGKVKVAHIMVRLKPTATDAEKTTAKQKIDEIYAKVMDGEVFGDLVRDHSDDRKSVQQNGELDWVEAGRYYPQFEDAAYALKEDAELSQPVQTPAGWHILKRIKFQPVDDLKTLRNELKNKIQRDARAQKTKASFIANLKKEYAFIENPKNLNQFIKTIDESIMTNQWSSEKTLLSVKGELFSFAGKSYSVQDFAQYIEQGQNFPKGKSIQDYAHQQYNYYVANELTEYEKTQLERKYPDYKMLIKEYRDGILLFEINDQKVWSYAHTDTTGLLEFSEANQSKYMWEERVDARIFTSTDKKIIKKAYKLVKKGELRNDSIVNLLNADSQLNISFESGRYETSKNEYLKDSDWSKEVGVNKPVLMNEKYVLIAIDKILPIQSKKLEEARGLYTAAYQDHLEETWLGELRIKYPVKVNKEVLYSIKKK